MQRVHITATPTEHGVLVRAKNYAFTFFDISRIRINLRALTRIAPKIRGVARVDDSTVYIEAIGDMSLLAYALQRQLVVFASIPVTVQTIGLECAQGQSWRLIITHATGEDIQDITNPLAYNLGAAFQDKIVVTPEPSLDPDIVSVVVTTGLVDLTTNWYDTLSELPLPRLDVMNQL